MLDWLFASPAERRLLGEARLRGPTPWVIAIMSFSIMIIAATGLALANTAGVLTQRDRGALLRSRCPAAAPISMRCCAAVRASPGVTSADAVPESEMRRTLERWLGPAAQSAELPVPALVNFDVDAGRRSRRDRAARRRRLLPARTIAAHRDSVGAAAALAAPAAVGRVRARPAAQRRGCGRRRARRARRARHAPLHDRSDARHRRDRPPGHPSVPAQDRDRRLRRQHRRRASRRRSCCCCSPAARRLPVS